MTLWLRAVKVPSSLCRRPIAKFARSPVARSTGSMASHQLPPVNCVVTGAAGLVGRRLVEMLVERGAERVVAFDMAPKPADFPNLQQVEWQMGSLTEANDVRTACQGADCVWHIGALVGPYFPKDAYGPVNYQGTLHVIDACREHKVRKIVMSSSPSTRFDGSSFYRVKGEDLPIRPPGQFLEPYAETKAQGEIALCKANDGSSLLTCAISPHQVYGPRDNLFLGNMLRNGAKMRIFGSGQNEISMVHVDNYCHALIIGEKALYPGSPALGKFYVVTDGPPVQCWDVIDRVVTHMGHPSIKSKTRVPEWLMMCIANVVHCCGKVLSTLFPGTRDYVTKGKGPFKLRPFAIKMLVIHRSFDISAARRDLGYEPLLNYDEAMDRTLKWYDENRSFWEPEPK